MKVILISAAAAFTLASGPIASAQETTDPSPIVVMAKYQGDWDKGSKLEAEGLAALEVAQRDLVKYSAEVANAQDKRDSSQSRAENARQAFQSLTARPYFSDPNDARDWARQVQGAAADWAKYDARQGDGANELRKAQKRQAGAQEAVAKAQSRIEKGRSLMAEAERSSIHQASL